MQSKRARVFLYLRCDASRIGVDGRGNNMAAGVQRANALSRCTARAYRRLRQRQREMARLGRAAVTSVASIL